ncbi:proteoglycan 4-like isoform X2 [Daphnia pulicaria]|nr:proteoglycan 4-like isoform X2 [Daphnia pulicaria]
MLGTRPLPGNGALQHGSESASSPPPLSNAAQLGATTREQLPSIENFSSTQSRSVSGRSPSRFADVPVSRSVNGANNSGNLIEHVIPHYQPPTTTIPTRRLSEPNRTRTAMVEDTRMRSSAASQVDMSSSGSRTKITARGLQALKGMSGNRDNEDEELQYGPGIVNKLKSRYLSRTLRERPLGESRRPSLRRAASLEDWLDKDSGPQHPSATENDFSVLVRSSNGRAKNERPISLNLVAAQAAEPKPPPAPSPSSSPSKIRDLKKTRSVDCVSQPPTWRSVSVNDLVVSPLQQPKPPKTPAAVPPSPTVTSPKPPVPVLLPKDAIVIVEKDDTQTVEKSAETKSNNVPVVTPPTAPAASSSSSASSKTRRTLPTNSRYNVEEAELPAPDTVRQVKRIFESGSGRKVLSTRRSQSAGPGINRTPLSAANQSSEKFNINRMNQVNLVNNKSAASVGRKKSDSNTPRITELVSPDIKPVVITKPSTIGPKPPVLSPKPAVVIEKTRVVQSLPNGATSMQRTAALTKLVSTPPPVSVASPSANQKEPVDPFEDEKKEKKETENHGLGHGLKIISKTALDNIHKESISINFNFDAEKKDEKSPFVIGPVQSRQVGVIRPQPKSPIIQNEKVVIFEEATSKDDVDSVSKKEELLLVTSPNAVPLVPLGFAKTPTKSEPAPSQTTAKPASPPVFASKSQTAGRTKQTTTTTPLAGSTAPKSEPVISTDARPSSPAAFVPVSLPPPVDKKVAENATVVSAAKAISSSSQIAKSSNSTPVNTTAILGAYSPSSGATQPSKKWNPHQSETTTVFNFVNDTSRKTDHIRNEGGSTGILVYKSNDSGITKLPDYDPGESSDFIDDLDILKRPPSPCNVDFEGANVIVGKSLIQRRPKKKLNITFNDDMTKLFEYPSETSFLEEGDEAVLTIKATHDVRDSSSQNSAANSKGGLSNYTPSKVHIETTFELGVSRPILPDLTPQPNQPNSGNQMGSVLHYIKPAEESTTWSAETTSDLLF